MLLFHGPENVQHLALRPVGENLLYARRKSQLGSKEATPRTSVVTSPATPKIPTFTTFSQGADAALQPIKKSLKVSTSQT